LKQLDKLLVSSMLVSFLAGAGWANVGLLGGVKTYYFHPSNENIQIMFEKFWGWGGEVGWVHNHIEAGAEMSYIRAKGKYSMQELIAPGVIGTFWPKLSALTVAPRVAFRFLRQRTPYVGLVVGYHRMTYKYIGHSYPSPIESSSAMSTEFFAGYDYRVFKWSGLRIEGGYRMPEPNENKPGVFNIYKDMRGSRASVGTYLIW